MAETHVVSGLAAKRSELTGLILDYQKKIDQMRVAVGHLDASIKLFAPDYDLRTVRAKVPRQRNSYFKPGECQRLVLDAFREAHGAALSSRQIGEALVQCKGLASSTEMIEQMQKNAIAVVKRLEDAGTVVLAGKDGTGRTWRLA
jgi:hypothetical protein